MSETVAIGAGAPQIHGSAIMRIVGVVTSPGASYADLVARPRCLAALALAIALLAASNLAFFATERGRQEMIDLQVDAMEARGRHVSDAQYRQLERMSEYVGYLGAASQLVFMPIATFIVSALAFAVFSAALGANASFRQTYAVVTHSVIIIALEQMFVLGLNYAKGSMTASATLGSLLPFLDDQTFPARFFGVIDLFFVWWMVNLAVGLSVLYRRRAAGLVTALLALYGGLALTIAGIKSFSG